jgi:uncharacterized protein YfaS (alpha-2-macroglobulin family)
MKIYQRGESIRIITYVYDINGNLMVPTTPPTTMICDPRGTAMVTSGAMTTTAVGIYYYEYATTSNSVLGKWTAYVTATDGAHSLCEQVVWGLRGIL